MNTATHTTADVQAYSTIKIDNNFNGVANALAANGYKVTNPSRESLGAQLLSIYWQNKPLYISILDSVPFNPNAKNYTTTADFANRLANWANNL